MTSGSPASACSRARASSIRPSRAMLWALRILASGRSSGSAISSNHFRAGLALAAVGSDLAEVEADQVGLRVAGCERAREVDLGLGGLVRPAATAGRPRRAARRRGAKARAGGRNRRRAPRSKRCAAHQRAGPGQAQRRAVGLAGDLGFELAQGLIHGAGLLQDLRLQQHGGLPAGVELERALDGGQRAHPVLDDHRGLGAGDVRLGHVQVGLGQPIDDRAHGLLVGHAASVRLSPSRFCASRPFDCASTRASWIWMASRLTSPPAPGRSCWPARGGPPRSRGRPRPTGRRPRRPCAGCASTSRSRWRGARSAGRGCCGRGRDRAAPTGRSARARRRSRRAGSGRACAA